MQIHELAALSGNPASGNVLAIDTGTVTRKIDYTALSKAIVEQYNGSTLAGSAQTVQAAINALNTATGKAVRYDTAQTLTSAQQAQARENIDAASVGEVSDLESALNLISEFGENLFIVDDAVDNKRLGTTGGYIDTTSGQLCFTSDYIEVEPKQHYYKNSLVENSYSRICYYDSTKTFITGSAYTQNESIAPDNAAYARFCGYAEWKANAAFYKVTAKDYVSRASNAALGDRLSLVILASKNLYNPANKMDGHQLYSSGVIASNETYNCTGYIDITGCENITIMLSKTPLTEDGTQNAFYDSSKSPVTTRNQLGEVKTNVAKTFAVPQGAKYFAMAWAASVMGEGSTIMVESGTSYTGYEPYGNTVIQSSAETVAARGGYSSLGERLDALTPGDMRSTLVYWGDSLTEGNQAGDGGSVPAYMQSRLPDWDIYNFGRGGDMSNSVACRQGGMNYVVKAGQTIPASGSVTFEITDNIGSANVGVRTYTDAFSWGLNPCEIAGVKGTLLRVSSAYPNNQAVFTRLESGSAVTIDRPTAVVSDGKNYVGDMLIIAIGTNQGFDTSKPQELVDIVRWMVNYSKSNNYLIMGLYHGSNNSWQANCNKALQAEFGRHFIDAEAYMKTPIYENGEIVSSYAMEDAKELDPTLTPTAQDITNIGNSVYPSSIMYDSIHFNKYGYYVIAKLQYIRGQELGYWE